VGEIQNVEIEMDDKDSYIFKYFFSVLFIFMKNYNIINF
jgi:hypothetical protein